MALQAMAQKVSGAGGPCADIAVQVAAGHIVAARACRFSPQTQNWYGVAGIRPKVSGPGQPNADFVVQGAADHGVRGLVNLFGIESPGLTSSLALADLVLARLADSKL